MSKSQNYLNNSNNDEKIRDIEEYKYLLEETVKEFQNSGEKEDDLLQAGYIGLLSSVNLYSNENDEVFKSKAKNLISGEIRNYIREKYKKVKIPKWLTMLNDLVNRVIVAYYREFNKFPDFKELSQMLNLSPKGLEEALKARDSVIRVSIDKNRRKRDIKDTPDILKIKKEIKRKGNEHKPGKY